jgi:hypothetical protein
VAAAAADDASRPTGGIVRVPLRRRLLRRPAAAAAAAADDSDISGPTGGVGPSPAASAAADGCCRRRGRGGCCCPAAFFVGSRWPTASGFQVASGALAQLGNGTHWQATVMRRPASGFLPTYDVVGVPTMSYLPDVAYDIVGQDLRCRRCTTSYVMTYDIDIRHRTCSTYDVVTYDVHTISSKRTMSYVQTAMSLGFHRLGAWKSVP